MYTKSHLILLTRLLSLSFGTLKPLQLRDPYYKYCSATGAGLYGAVAGVSTPFYIQCRDAFGDPANTASFQVD